MVSLKLCTPVRIHQILIITYTYKSQIILCIMYTLHWNITAHKTAICHNPHHSSHWDSHITRQLGYKHTSCQNVMSTKNIFSLYLHKTITCLHVGLWMICQVFSLYCKTVCWWSYLSKWPTWRTYSLFYNKFITVLYMFQVPFCSSWGQIVLIQHLVFTLKTSEWSKTMKVQFFNKFNNWINITST
jgi:hypothetical protein